MEHRINFNPMAVVAKEKFASMPGGTITLAAPRAVQTGEDEAGVPLFEIVAPDERAPDDTPHGRVTFTVDNDEAFNAVSIGEPASAAFTFSAALPEPSLEQRKAIVRPSREAMAAAMGVALHDDAVATARAAERVADSPVRRAAPKSAG